MQVLCFNALDVLQQSCEKVGSAGKRHGSVTSSWRFRSQFRTTGREGKIAAVKPKEVEAADRQAQANRYMRAG